MDIQYVNSHGESLNLISDDFLLLSNNTLFNYEWQYDTFNNAYINNFRTGIKSMDIQIKVSGRDYEEFLDNLNKITDTLNYDNLNDVRGKLYFNKYYMYCNITMNTKPSKFLLRTQCVLSLTLVSDEPSWYLEQMVDIIKNDPSGTSQVKDYDYDYPVDYLRSIGTDGYFENPFDHSTDAVITIYGAISHPDILINDTNYKINYDLSEGDKLILNTLRKTITLIKKNGRIQNAFKYRDSEYYPFNKIPPGHNTIYWNSSANIEINLIYERGEPKWKK